MDWTYIRLVAHLLLIVDAVTAGWMLWMVRGQLVRIQRIRWALAGLAFAVLWLTLLAASARGLGIVPRELLIPLLASLELAGGVMFAMWLWKMYRITFRTTVNVRHMLVFGLWVLR